jgi:hypothetical protein
MSKDEARRFAATVMSKHGVPFAYPVQNDDGTWRVEMVA